MSRFTEIMRQMFKYDTPQKPQDHTLPAWREVCRLYFVEPDEDGHFEYDVVVRVINISAEAETVSIVLSCQILRPHPAYKEKDYISRQVEITFRGVTDPSVTAWNERIPRDQILSFAHETYFSVSRLEIKPDLDGIHRSVAGQESYYYYCILFAESFKMMFPFEDLSYRELTEEEYSNLVDTAIDLIDLL